MKMGTLDKSVCLKESALKVKRQCLNHYIVYQSVSEVILQTTDVKLISICYQKKDNAKLSKMKTNHLHSHKYSNMYFVSFTKRKAGFPRMHLVLYIK